MCHPERSEGRGQGVRARCFVLRPQHDTLARHGTLARHDTLARHGTLDWHGTAHSLESPAESGSDIRQGFVYGEVPHITLKSLANDEPPETETLYDRPYVDKSRLRVAGPFTVETLQAQEPAAVDDGRLAADGDVPGASGTFEATKVRMHDDLLQEGLTKKDKKAASFVTIGEPDVALVPYVGVMLRTQDEASGRERSAHVASTGSFAGAQDDTGAGKERHVQVVIQGLDIYDPIRDEVRARSVHDIAYWVLDDDYDGSNFIVRQVFFCGGDKDEFDKWKRGISDLSKQLAKANAQRMLRLELDDEAWERLYGFTSHPIPAMLGRRIAVRVVSQFGEESMKVVKI